MAVGGDIDRPGGGIEPIKLQFGGGIASRPSSNEIDPRECTEGVNFDIDIENSAFQRRPVIDLVGTAPNNGQINGFAQLRRINGSVSTLVQAADTVYEWDGSSGFTSVGTVSSSARLRGGLEQNFTIDEVVIITDLALAENVKQWDGTTFQDAPMSITNFKARYCEVELERAWYANVAAPNVTEHIIVASKSGDYKEVTVSAAPAAADDPLFLLAPDLRPLRGVIAAFNSVYITTRNGRVYRIVGNDATDYAFDKFESSTGASGMEAFAFIGNDIVLGNDGRIDTVFGVENFGDARTDDLSRKLSGLKGLSEWQIVYNECNQKIYVIAKNSGICLVANKSFLDDVARRAALRAPFAEASPWTRYSTLLPFSFNTEAIMTFYDPINLCLETFVGGLNGEIYKMDGTGTTDGGQFDVRAERLSGVFSIPFYKAYDIEGLVQYESRNPATLYINFEFQGDQVFDRDIVVNLQGDEGNGQSSGGSYYGGNFYYGGNSYYGQAFSGRVRSKYFKVGGSATKFQIRTRVEGASSFAIQEIDLQFKAST